MKKAILYIVIILFSASLYSAEPLVKFYLQDGSTNQYNLSEIDSLGVFDKKNNYVMRIHYDDSLVAYYPTEIIGSIKFEKDSVKRDILNVYIFSYPKTYKLSSIDSITFYIDQWQPLTIGSQVWMLKNLNVDHYRNGDSIPEILVNQEIGRCGFYNNDSAMGAIYSKLYNWYAVNDKRGLAPTGWHIPSNEEWERLITYLGGNNDASVKMKESGTLHWQSPNSGATNSSGFSALPGGGHFFYGADSGVRSYGNWWSSTEYDIHGAWAVMLRYDNSLVFIGYLEKVTGFSVRCIKDK